MTASKGTPGWYTEVEKHFNLYKREWNFQLLDEIAMQTGIEEEWAETELEDTDACDLGETAWEMYEKLGFS